MIFIARAFATLLLASSVAAARPADPRPSIALISVTRGPGFTQQQTDEVEEVLLAALDRTGRLRVIGRSDINSLLTLEARKQAAGCNDTGCMAEIAGALGVDYVAAASIGRLGAVTVVSLKVIDAGTATVLTHGMQTVRSDSDLVSACDSLAAAVAGHVPERNLAAAGHGALFALQGRPHVAIRAGFGGLNGILGLGIEARWGWLGLGIGTGTYALTGGPSITFPEMTRLGGPYVNVLVAWSKTYIPDRSLPPGIGIGATAGWDWRFVKWLSLKTGIGGAYNTAKGAGLVWDLAIGPEF